MTEMVGEAHWSKDPDEVTCVQCGADVWVADDGTAHHWGGGMDGVDYESDADHVAIPDVETDS